MKVRIMLPMIWEIDESHPMVEMAELVGGAAQAACATTGTAVQNAIDLSGMNVKPSGKPGNFAVLTVDPDRIAMIVEEVTAR